MSPHAGDAALAALAVVLCCGGVLFLLAGCGRGPGRRGRRPAGVPAPLASQSLYVSKHLGRLGHDMAWAACPGQLAGCTGTCAGCGGVVSMTIAGAGPADLTFGFPLADQAGRLVSCPGPALAGPLPAVRRDAARIRLAGEPG
jgi:hypothetical protein